jgi:hypothetical protein
LQGNLKQKIYINNSHTLDIRNNEAWNVHLEIMEGEHYGYRICYISVKYASMLEDNTFSRFGQKARYTA